LAHDIEQGPCRDGRSTAARVLGEAISAAHEVFKAESPFFFSQRNEFRWWMPALRGPVATASLRHGAAPQAQPIVKYMNTNFARRLSFLPLRRGTMGCGIETPPALSICVALHEWITEQRRDSHIVWMRPPEGVTVPRQYVKDARSC